MKNSLKKKWIASAVVATMLFTLAGCAKEEEQPTFTGDVTKEPEYQVYLNEISPAAYSEVRGLNLEPGTYISIIGKDEASDFWKNVEKGALQAGKDLNAELGYTGADKIKVVYNASAEKEDIDEQVNILDEELARYPDVVGIASIDADACIVQFDLATENGIPIVALDSGNSYPGIQCTVRTDNAEAARTGAYKMADAMGREGKILVIAHDVKSETGIARTESFQKEIQENYPDIQIAHTVCMDEIQETKKAIVVEQNPELPLEEQTAAVQSMSNEDVIQYYLEQDPEIKGIFGTNDVSTQLGVKALDQAEKTGEILLMGFDAGKSQIQAMKDGKIAGLVVQNPFAIGYASVIASARTVLQIGNEAVVNTGYVWVTPDNLEKESIQKMIY